MKTNLFGYKDFFFSSFLELSSSRCAGKNEVGQALNGRCSSGDGHW
jgi:hypothetical protein